MSEVKDAQEFTTVMLAKLIDLLVRKEAGFEDGLGYPVRLNELLEMREAMLELPEVQRSLLHRI